MVAALSEPTSVPRDTIQDIRTATTPPTMYIDVLTSLGEVILPFATVVALSVAYLILLETSKAAPLVKAFAADT